MAGSTSDFVDLIIWGIVSFVLAGMSYVGWLGKRRDRREAAGNRQRQADRDDRLETLLRQQRDAGRYPTEQPH